MDKYISRATFLLAANAFALIQLMDIAQRMAAGSMHALATLLVGIPALGMCMAYNMLEMPEKPNRWEEWLACLCPTVMILLWGAWQLGVFGTVVALSPHP